MKSDRGDGAPARLGHWERLEEIGRGAMGVVYRASESVTGRPAALKMLRRDCLSSLETRERFIRECQLAARLSHPNVVSVLDSGVDGAQPYYVMELVDGEPLDRILAERSADRAVPGTDTRLIGWRSIVDAFAATADGLHHAHDRRVIHRDVKPSNLMLDRFGRLRLLDFGLACASDAAIQLVAGQTIGTPRYMSPEQVEGRKDWSAPATDLWSLGATLYEALSGSPPFQGEPGPVMRGILTDSPRPLRELRPEIPREVERIVFQCLRKNPRLRPASAAHLAQHLRRIARNPSASSSIAAALRDIRSWLAGRWRRFSFIAASLTWLTT